MEKRIAKLKKNLTSLRVPIEQHVIFYSNLINENFGAWEHYINSHVQEKEEIMQEPNAISSSRSYSNFLTKSFLTTSE